MINTPAAITSAQSPTQLLKAWSAGCRRAVGTRLAELSIATTVDEDECLNGASFAGA